MGYHTSENYLAAYYSVQDEFFAKAGTPVSLVITHADYTNEKTLTTINSFLHKVRPTTRHDTTNDTESSLTDSSSSRTGTQVEDSGCTRQGSIANWYSDYIMYLVSKGQNITNFYQPQDGTSKLPPSHTHAHTHHFKPSTHRTRADTTNIALWLDSPSGGQYAKVRVPPMLLTTTCKPTGAGDSFVCLSPPSAYCVHAGTHLPQQRHGEGGGVHIQHGPAPRQRQTTVR